MIRGNRLLLFLEPRETSFFIVHFKATIPVQERLIQLWSLEVSNGHLILFLTCFVRIYIYILTSMPSQTKINEPQDPDDFQLHSASSYIHE